MAFAEGLDSMMGSFYDPQLVTCPGCTTDYNLEGHAPKLLPCHHSLCVSCCFKLKKEDDGQITIVCQESECQIKSVVPAGDVRKITDNHYIIPTLKKRAALAEKKQRFCAKHGQELLFFCNTDSVPICQGCTVLDHPLTVHDVCDIGEAKTKRVTEVKLKTDTIEANTTRCNETAALLANIVKYVDAAKEDKLTRNKDYFRTLRKELEYLVNRREKECEEQIQGKYQEEISHLTADEEKVREASKMLSECKRKLEACMVEFPITFFDSVAALSHEADQDMKQALQTLQVDTSIKLYHFKAQRTSQVLATQLLEGTGEVMEEVYDQPLPKYITIKEPQLNNGVVVGKVGKRLTIKFCCLDVQKKRVKPPPLFLTGKISSKFALGYEKWGPADTEDWNEIIVSPTEQDIGEKEIQIFFCAKILLGKIKVLIVQ